MEGYGGVGGDGVILGHKHTLPRVSETLVQHRPRYGSDWAVEQALGGSREVR